ncbi:E3 ubiquitin-protein ligase TRIM71-like isoform X2 [Dysidea avara]|uniref:E3 ubiquitin-protein ligase TRIM71-like isoform X2 n=1 Tax=Dysidea avara TaxID=196820 RepID=UPI0033233AA5
MDHTNRAELDKFRGTGVPLLRDLQNHVTPQYAAYWRKIGVQLGLLSGALDIIEHDNHHKATPCCDAMLSKWLEVDHTATWSKLIDVIQSPAVSHSATELPTAMDTTELIMEPDDEIEEMSKRLTEAHDNIGDMMKKIEEQGGEVNKEIDQRYDELVEKLMKQKDQVKLQVTDAVTQKKQTLATQLHEVESVQEEVQGFKMMNDSLKASKHDDSYAKNKQIVTKHFQNVKSIYRKLKFQAKEMGRITVVPNKFTLPSICHLSEDLNSSSSNYTFLFPDYICANVKVEATLLTKSSKKSHGEQVSVQLETSTGEVTAADVQNNNDGSYAVSFVGKQVGNARIMVTVDGKQIKGSPYSIVLCKNYKALNLPSKVVRDSLDKPYGIAFGCCGVWAVADQGHQCVYVFNSKDQLARKIGKYTGNCEINYCYGVAFDADNYLYVTDGNVIKKFDINGNFLIQFGSSGDGQLKFSKGITTHDNKVYVANTGNKCISVFQCDGQFCASFGSYHLSQPSDVVVNVNNQVLVTDSSRCRICIFTLDGTFERSFGPSIPNDTNLRTPCSLATDKYGFIFVIDGGKFVTDSQCCVVVLDQHGNFIHSFGFCDSFMGMSNYCYGIAVSLDGSIYVSDRSNKKIHIFSYF